MRQEVSHGWSGEVASDLYGRVRTSGLLLILLLVVHGGAVCYRPSGSILMAYIFDVNCTPV